MTTTTAVDVVRHTGKAQSWAGFVSSAFFFASSSAFFLASSSSSFRLLSSSSWAFFLSRSSRLRANRSFSYGKIMQEKLQSALGRKNRPERRTDSHGGHQKVCTLRHISLVFFFLMFVRKTPLTCLQTLKVWMNWNFILTPEPHCNQEKNYFLVGLICVSPETFDEKQPLARGLQAFTIQQWYLRHNRRAGVNPPVERGVCFTERLYNPI